MRSTELQSDDGAKHQADEAGSGSSESPETRGPSDPHLAGPSWFRYLGSGWSTLLLIGLTATASQLIALEMAGLELGSGAQAWSSGGLVAAVAALWMWRRVPTWDGFKRAIWVPVLLVSALSFLAIGLQNNYDVAILDREARSAPASVGTGTSEGDELPQESAQSPSTELDETRKRIELARESYPELRSDYPKFIFTSVLGPADTPWAVGIKGSGYELCWLNVRNNWRCNGDVFEREDGQVGFVVERVRAIDMVGNEAKEVLLTGSDKDGLPFGALVVHDGQRPQLAMLEPLATNGEYGGTWFLEWTGQRLISDYAKHNRWFDHGHDRTVWVFRPDDDGSPRFVEKPL